jgi:tetratricopeptide (TPR) repeat protein
MRPLHVGILTAALYGAAVVAPASAMSVNTPSGGGGGMQLQSADPAQPKPKKKKAPEKSEREKPEKKSEQLFIEGYRYAYDLVYKRQNYADAITALRALGRDDHPDVANLIGFSSRKLGRTEDAKVWYEKALAADPKHSRTWQYYGMWHLERGDRAKAEEYLKTIATICGTGCEDYTSLKLALAGEGLVY